MSASAVPAPRAAGATNKSFITPTRAALVHGLPGQLLTIVLISVGLGGALLLVFLEVGLSEDRDRASEDQRRRERTSRRIESRRALRSRSSRRPRRPG